VGINRLAAIGNLATQSTMTITARTLQTSNRPLGARSLSQVFWGPTEWRAHLKERQVGIQSGELSVVKNVAKNSGLTRIRSGRSGGRHLAIVANRTVMGSRASDHRAAGRVDVVADGVNFPNLTTNRNF
jgi:hypothetical protein